MQNLQFGPGSEAKWLESGSKFPADLVPRTRAQQQVPKMEPAVAVCFGGGRRRVGPSETEKQRHLSGDFGRLHLSRVLAVCDRGLPLCHHWALGQRLRATSSNSGGSSGAVPVEGDMLLQPGEADGVPASDAAPLPHSKQVLGTPRSRIKPSLCTSPAGSLAQSKPYNNKLGCESETKNNSVRKQISGSGCQGVITLNNRQSIISTVMRDVLTVSFQNGKQADGFRIKNTGTERKKEGASKKLHKKLRPCGRTVEVPMATALGRAISFRAGTTAGVTSQKTVQVTASPRTVSPLGHQPRGREIDTSPLPPGSRQSRGNNARLRKSECPQRCAGPWLSW